MERNNWRLGRNDRAGDAGGALAVIGASGADVASGGAPRVWVNTRTGIYHYPGTRGYGRSADGVFLTAAQAHREGYRPAPPALAEAL